MALNFPDPGVSTIYTADGITYTYDAVKGYWRTSTLDAGIATAGQGALADSAVQPGDNVSDLVNDADYLIPGDNVSDLINDAGYLIPGDNVSDLINDAGYATAANPVFTGSIEEQTGTMPAGTTPAIDPANGTVQEWTLTGNSSPTDSLADGEFVELLIQDGTAYTITWPTITWLTDGAAAPILGLTTVTPVLIQKVGSTLYGRRTGDGG